MKKKNRKERSVYGPYTSGETLSCESVNLSFPKGMDLRDRFALETMKVILESRKVHKMTLKNRIKGWFGMTNSSIISLPNLKNVASASYLMADAMMFVRKENEQ